MNAANETVMTSEPLARVGAAPRFVQLPQDVDADVMERTTTSSNIRRLLPARQEQLLAALVALLYRYSQQQTIALDVVVSTANRASKVALDFEVTGDMPIGTLVESARVLLSAGVARSANEAGTPANVAVAFGVVPDDSESAFIAGASIASISTSHDIYFVFAQTSQSTLLTVQTSSTSIPSSSVDRWLDCLTVLLDAVAVDTTTPIERLPLLSSIALKALTEHQESIPASRSRVTVIRSFEAIARQQPQTIAVVYHNYRFTYGDLDERSTQLAHRLLACGVKKETTVAVCIPPSHNVLIAILAIWKARGIYLPLDPTHPSSLITRMLDEAQPRVVLTVTKHAELTKTFPQFLFDCEADIDLLDSAPKSPLPVEPSLTDSAYLIYTSGTTGKSKGVLATQANLGYYVRSAIQQYRFSSEDVFISLARYTFSISLFELIAPVCCGASLRILDRDEVLTPALLCRTLEEVTVLHAGPSLLTSVFRHLRAQSPSRTFPKMRHASSGGDIVPPRVLEEMKQVFPNAEIFVIYGCTEISCMGTTFPVPRDRKLSRTFVGKPFPCTMIRVLDAKRELVPWGVVGEIYFSGEGVVPGYFEQPELTSERFVDIGGQRFYQTGDMGRLQPDGNLEILGRRDFQVQIRGIRVELVGIEHVVQDLQLAAQCAVVAKTMDDGEMRLIAFLVKPRNQEAVATFRRTLAAELPDYMVPHYVVELDAMPLTVNGKLDRNQLMQLARKPQLDTPTSHELDARPATETERRIAEVFARVLGRSSVGVDQGFFDLGGDSLLGVVALDQISRMLGVTVAPHVLFETGTARSIASYARGNVHHEARPVILNEASTKPAIFMLSGLHIYRELAQHLGGDWAAYGVFAPSEFSAYDNSDVEDHTVEALAREYLELIRTKQPRGPYRLVGYSFAGLVAYELAQLLRALGEEVRFLAMLDAALPEWSMGWRYRWSQVARARSAPAADVASFVLRRARERLMRLEDVEFIRHKNDSQLAPLEERRNAFNRIASERYIQSIRPYDGPVTLVASGQRLKRDPLKSPNCGWGPFVSSLDLHTVDADHFSMLTDEPHVTDVARILLAGLSRAEVAKPRSSPTPDSC